MSIGNSLTTKKDKEKEQNEWSRKLQNLLEAGKIQEAWEKEMKRERKYYGNPIHRRFFQLVHSTRQERKAMDRHGDIAKKIQLLKRKRELNQRVLKEFLRLPAYKKKGPDQIWKMIQNSNCSEMEDILSDLFKAFQKAHTDLNPGRKVEAPESDLNPEMEASQSNRKRTFFKKFLNWMGVGRKKKEDEEDEEDEEELYTWIALRIHQEMRMNHKSFQPRENKKLFLPEFEMLDDARNLYMENPEMWWRASIEEMFDLEQDPNKNLTASSNQKKDSKLEKKNQAKKNQQQQSQAGRDSNVKEKDNKKKSTSTTSKRKRKKRKNKHLFKAFLKKFYGHCPLQLNLLDYNSKLMRVSDIPLVLRRHAEKKVQNGSFSSGVRTSQDYLEARIAGFHTNRLIAECDYEGEELLEFVLTNAALIRTRHLLELPEKDDPDYLDGKKKRSVRYSILSHMTSSIGIQMVLTI